jgi:hypothetical protein
MKRNTWTATAVLMRQPSIWAVLAARMKAPLYILALICFAFPLSAQAAAKKHGILGGLAMEWYGSGNGAKADTVLIQVGNAYVDDTLVQFTSATADNVFTPTTFCQDYRVSNNTASASYYLYISQGTLIYLASIQPTSDGHPSSNLANTTTGSCNLASTSSLVFLGSVVTDPSGHLIPFARNGEEVVLIPSIAQGSTTFDPGAGQLSQAVTHGDHTPKTYNFYFGNSSASPLGLPKSASAMVVDFYFQNADTTSGDSATVYVLQPYLNTITAPCTLNSQLGLYSLASTTSFVRSRVKMSTAVNGVTTMVLGECTAPGHGSATLYATFRGYTEPIPTLEF